jgi:hypothetical protein
MLVMPSSQVFTSHKERGKWTTSKKTHVKLVAEINMYDFGSRSPK